MSADFGLHLTILIGVFLLLSLSAHLLIGEAGQLSLAQAGFFAIGAYATAIIASRSIDMFLPAVGLGMVLGAAMGALLGLPAVRISGDYLAIATLAAGEILRTYAKVWGLTGGSFGISMPPPRLFGYTLDGKASYALLVWAVAAGVILWLRAIRRRRFGLALNAIREDEVAASSMGYRVPVLKIAVFALSGALGALAGSLYAGYMLYVDSTVFSAILAINILVIVVLGGVGSILGVLAATAVYVLLPEVLSDFSNYRDVVYGAALVLVMMLRPKGLIPERRPPSPDAVGLRRRLSRALARRPQLVRSGDVRG